MSDTLITLSEFFSLTEQDLVEKRLDEIESSPKISSMKEACSKEAKGIKWPVAFKEIVKKIGDLLNIGLPDIMVMAWNNSLSLRKYLDKEKYPPEQTFLAPLIEHTIQSAHHPSIEIQINGKMIGKIELDINLALTLKGIVLKIQDGKIKEILTGSCKGKGTIKCENILIKEKETETVSLPGSIHLGEGVPIL